MFAKCKICYVTQPTKLLEPLVLHKEVPSYQIVVGIGAI